jgi:16S rRNA (uracil1498-N3)-methyltransferase
MPTRPAAGRPRFLATKIDVPRAEAHLAADESRHLTRVLRLGVGALVSVFDGRGREFVARVAGVGGPEVTLELLDPIEARPDESVPFTLGAAVLKGQAMDAVVRDATMMGAVTIQPLLSVHVAVKASVATRADQLDRWRRVAVASAKQSRRATLPDVNPPATLASVLDGRGPGVALMFVEPLAAREARPVRTLIDTPRPPGVLLLVGPEGGWSGEEVDMAISRGAIPVTLGAMTLRADAVPLAAMAILRLLWE